MSFPSRLTFTPSQESFVNAVGLGLTLGSDSVQVDSAGSGLQFFRIYLYYLFHAAMQYYHREQPYSVEGRNVASITSFEYPIHKRQSTLKCNVLSFVEKFKDIPTHAIDAL